MTLYRLVWPGWCDAAAWASVSANGLSFSYTGTFGAGTGGAARAAGGQWPPAATGLSTANPDLQPSTAPRRHHRPEHSCPPTRCIVGATDSTQSGQYASSAVAAPLCWRPARSGCSPTTTALPRQLAAGKFGHPGQHVVGQQRRACMAIGEAMRRGAAEHHDTQHRNYRDHHPGRHPGRRPRREHSSRWCSPPAPTPTGSPAAPATARWAPTRSRRDRR